MLAVDGVLVGVDVDRGRGFVEEAVFGSLKASLLVMARWLDGDSRIKEHVWRKPRNDKQRTTAPKINYSLFLERLQSLLQPSNPPFKSLNVPPRNLPVLAHTILKPLDSPQQLVHP